MKINTSDYGKWEPIVEKLRQSANKHNLNVYIVGGFVRDLLIGRAPKDLDVMVDAEEGGIKLAEAMAKDLGLGEPVIFPRFGTAKLTVDGEEVEFVAPRKEIYEEDNRKPTTVKGNLWDGRDFSVNALFIDLRNNEVVDLTGNGIKDIEEGVLRVADPENPDVIMTADPLRMLRLIRQASQLNFSIDPATFNAVKDNAQKISTISKERVQEELNKMLMTDKPSRSLTLLKDAGLLDYILTDLGNLEGTEDDGPADSKNVWSHTLQVVDNAPKNLVVRLAALFHDVGKPATKSRTYKVTCPKCADPVEYVYKTQPNVGITCQNGTCDGNLNFDTEKELYEAFPKYDVHFYDHERVGATTATKVLRDLRYSDDIIKEVNSLITHHMKGHAYSDDWTDSAVRRYRFDTDPYTENLMDLTQSDVTSKNPEKRKKNRERINRLRERMRILDEQEQIAKIQSPLNGNELMQMFPDKKPGEWLKKIKDMLLNEVLDGNLKQNDKEGARRLLQGVDPDRLASLEENIKLSWREQ
jgi:putative nucleotidyltransferase with HDIG domain